MFFVFLTLWIIFNGKITVEICLSGIVAAGVLYAFICRFMDYSVKKDVAILSRVPLILHFLFVLVREIAKANFATIRMIMTTRYELEPVMITVKTRLKTKPARVALANSITLTPGTITVSLEEDRILVHCLDKDFSEGIGDSVLVKLLERIEEPFVTGGLKEGGKDETV